MLAQEWTLSVRDFGPIKSADVTTAPLMVFSGKNNTGKSYLSSLFWALSNIVNYRSMFDPDNSGFDRSRSLFFDMIRGDGHKDRIEIDDVFANALMAEANLFLSNEIQKMTRRLYFIDQGLNVGAIKIANFRRIIPASFEVQESETGGPWLSQTFKGGQQTYFIADGKMPHFSPHAMLYCLLFGRLYKYIPAGRTGLALSLRSLMRTSVDSALTYREHREESDKFPLATAQFVQDVIQNAGTIRGRHQDIARHLERDIIGGIIFSEEKVPNLWMGLASGHLLPIHAASSLVTELAPFILLLKSGALDDGFVFEEPEAHLHLDAQRALARALARLLNRGVPMILTTHSDTFLQQLNIQMWLHQHHKRDQLMEQLGYAEDELIDPKMARGYHFEPEEGGTVVYEMEKRHEGLVVPSMNKVIMSMQDEIAALQAAED